MYLAKHITFYLKIDSKGYQGWLLHLCLRFINNLNLDATRCCGIFTSFIFKI